MATTAGGRPELRVTFVEMLFALTVAEIAFQAAEVSKSGVGPELLPAFAHLSLALVVVSTSWIGWARSPSPANRVALESVFSWSFVVLLLDVLLVVFYFILVRGVEISHNGSGGITQPSAHHEALWVVLIFAGYCAWDVVTKVIMKPPPGETAPSYWERGLPTIASFALSGLVLCTVGNVVNDRSVLAVDVCLLLLVLFFRALKEGRRKSGGILLSGFVVALVVAHLLG